MNEQGFNFSPTDFRALTLADSNYLNNKGAKAYAEERYAEAAKYYHLAAAMGNLQAVSNLGYCYLYGRHCAPNVPFALSYFTAAAARGSVDVAYKLGDIYSRDKRGLRDEEMSLYYYRMAASYVLGDDWETEGGIRWNEELLKYPSLCFALGREICPDGTMATDVSVSFQFLVQAARGYKIALANGERMYESSYFSVRRLMTDSRYDAVREDFEEDPEDLEF